MTSNRNKVGHPKNDEYWTPKWIFEGLGLHFDLDVASPGYDLTHVPAKKVFTIHENGLSQNWHGLVWMNPPFSKPAPWVEKWLNHGNGFALLPISQGKWFDAIWSDSDGIMVLPKCMKFDRPDNARKDIFFRTCLAAIGNVSYQALVNSNLGKVR